MQQEQKSISLRFELESLTSDPWGESRSAHFKFRNAAIKKLFPGLIVTFSNPVGLDLASGTGTLAKGLHAFFHELTCVEADEKCVQRFRSNHAELNCVCLKLPELPACENIDVITMFGAIYYLSNEQIAELCKNALMVLQAKGVFIINNLSEERKQIILGCGFRLISKSSFRRPKYKLTKITKTVRTFELLKAIIHHDRDPAVLAFINATKRPMVRMLFHADMPFKKSFVQVFSWLLCPLRFVDESLVVYKALQCLGTEECNIYVFGKSVQS